MIARNWYRVLAAVVVISQTIAIANAQEFPFEGELLLDARPMPGSKRIPNMDISANGTIALEMWCNHVEGQVVVAGDTITVITGQPTDRGCPPERARADTELLDALSGVTNWRRQGDSLVLIGPKTLRFKVPTN
jgi:heat shock protein HslJ